MPKAYSDNPIGATLPLTPKALAKATAHAILQEAQANSTVLGHVGSLSAEQKGLLEAVLRSQPANTPVAFRRRKFADETEARDGIVSYDLNDQSGLLTVTFA